MSCTSIYQIDLGRLGLRIDASSYELNVSTTASLSSLTKTGLAEDAVQAIFAIGAMQRPLVKMSQHISLHFTLSCGAMMCREDAATILRLFMDRLRLSQVGLRISLDSILVITDSRV
jgi:hypothetical protein